MYREARHRDSKPDISTLLPIYKVDHSQYNADKYDLREPPYMECVSLYNECIFLDRYVYD
jgi:hypothetical protein